MLSDSELLAAMHAGELRMEPKPSSRTWLQPASLDLTLGSGVLVYGDALAPGECGVVDPRRGVENPQMHEVPCVGGVVYLTPGQFALASTAETISLASTLGARIEGKSSVGRRGLAVHITAGFIDPGFSGRITLELYNFTQFWMRLTIGMPICQLAVERIDGRVLKPYGSPGLGSAYQGQTGTTEGR